MFRRSTPLKKQQSTDGVVIKDTAPCQKSLSIQLKPDDVALVRAGVVSQFQKEAALPGFRKGKAPSDLIERQYSQAIQEETIKRSSRQTLERIAKDHGLKPIGPFELKSAKMTEDGGLTLEATVEIEPAFTLGSYKGISLKQVSTEVADSDVDKALAQLAESMAQLVPVDETGKKERKVPAIDDELAKDLGFKQLGELRSHVDAKLREQKRVLREQQLESALFDELLLRHTFEIPSSMVSHQTQRLRRDFKARLLLSGMSEEKVNEELGKFSEQLRTSAQRQVKLSFILDRIAQQESVEVSQDEMLSRLWQLSQRLKKDPSQLRKMFDEQGLWLSVASTIRQEKTVAFLLSAASIDGDPSVQSTSHEKERTHD